MAVRAVRPCDEDVGWLQVPVHWDQNRAEPAEFSAEVGKAVPGWRVGPGCRCGRQRAGQGRGLPICRECRCARPDISCCSTIIGSRPQRSSSGFSTY